MKRLRFVVAAFAAAALVLRSAWATETPARWVVDNFPTAEAGRDRVSLDGAWELRRDPAGHTEPARWIDTAGRFPESVLVPGAPQAQGIGAPATAQRTDFREGYWIRRSFRMVALPRGQRAWLRLGGVFPAADVWLNGAFLGEVRGSRVPLRADATDALLAGPNTVALHIHEPSSPRLDGVWDWSGIPHWNGPYRPIDIELTPALCLVDACVRPMLGSGDVEVSGRLSEPAPDGSMAVLRVLDGTRVMGTAEVRLRSGAESLEARVPVAKPEPWSPWSPKLYRLEVRLRGAGGAAREDRVGVRFGFREIERRGADLCLNGVPLFLRCYGDDQLYPETLAPPASVAWYRDRLRVARAFGMNAAKSCVECFPEEYLAAADELGLLIIEELPSGLDGQHRERRHAADPEYRAMLTPEVERIVQATRNHPSVVAYSMASELGYGSQTQESFAYFSGELPRRVSALAPGALTIDCTGYTVDGEGPASRIDTGKGPRETDAYVAGPPAWAMEPLRHAANSTDGLRPFILHEFNWWSCYPDVAAAERYDGAQLRPFWFDLLRDTARRGGQEGLVGSYHRASEHLQAACRKDGIEYARRQPEVDGFILWLITDLAQWSEGLLDDFWAPKGVSAANFLRSNGDSVVLLAEDERRCFAMGDSVRLPLMVSHFGQRELTDARVTWSAEGGPVHARGDAALGRVAMGSRTPAGTVELRFPARQKGYVVHLSTVLADGCRVNDNEWDLFVMPRAVHPAVEACGRGESGSHADGVFLRVGEGATGEVPPSARLVVAERLDDGLCRWLADGGRALVLSAGGTMDPAEPAYADQALYRLFRTVPWNVGPGNSGTLIEPHAALSSFPHGRWCDLQFVGLLSGALPLNFEPWRTYGVTPIIRAIDWYQANKNHAYLLECQVGRGRALVSTMRLLPATPDRPEARALLDGCMRYLLRDSLPGVASIPPAEFARLAGAR